MSKEIMTRSRRSSSTSAAKGFSSKSPHPCKKSRSSSTLPQTKSRTTTYNIIESDLNKKGGPKLQLEVEGIAINSRGESKDTTYFECSSHRQRNAPDCHFRAKINNFDTSLRTGAIEVTSDHSSTCKFQAGNHAQDFIKNTELDTAKRTYKTMKLSIEKHLEDHSWLTPGEVLKWIKESFSIDMHLSYS